MKRLIILVVISVFGIVGFSQTVIPNNDFENWTLDKPTSWDATNFNILGVVVTTVTIDSLNPHSGLKAVKLSTTTELVYGTPVTVPGLITLGKFNIDLANYTGSVSGGIAFTGRPVKLIGYIETKPILGDSSLIAIQFSKWNGTAPDTIGEGMIYIDSIQNGWHYFECPITFNSPNLPDSMNIVISSSDLINDVIIDGSRMRIDNISLDYGNIVVEENFANTHFRVWSDEYKTLHYNVGEIGDEISSLRVFSINGIEIYRINLDNNELIGSINLHGTPSGVYLVGVQAKSGKVYTKRFVLK